MAINPSTDIILDVARAADPAAAEVARARLERLTGGVADVSDSARSPAFRTHGGKKVPETFVKFEAMVLQTFMQQLLPQESEAVYGEGLAGDMWKSFMAQELGKSLAEAGGVGIASRILSDFYMSGDKRIPVAGVSAGPEKAETDKQGLLSVALVQEIQRTISRQIGQDIALQSSPETP